MLDSITGILSGIPTVASSVGVTFTIQVANSFGKLNTIMTVAVGTTTTTDAATTEAATTSTASRTTTAGATKIFKHF